MSRFSTIPVSAWLKFDCFSTDTVVSNIQIEAPDELCVQLPLAERIKPIKVPTEGARHTEYPSRVDTTKYITILVL